MKSFTLILIFLMSGYFPLSGEVSLYMNPTHAIDGKETALTLEGLSKRDFPKPLHHRPILFIHGHGSGEGQTFRRDWMHPNEGLPSFRETLGLTENAGLELEPYYLNLEDHADNKEKQQRTIAQDAAKIEEAVQLILLHQGDPAAQKIKISIIAFGRGAISARYYLKKLLERQNGTLSFHPVSELIAISPPNHGYLMPVAETEQSAALMELANGCDAHGKPLKDPAGFAFMEALNGHTLRDTTAEHFAGQLYDSEAPASRRNGERVCKGILYVSLFSGDNDCLAGGASPSDDAMGRMLAANLAPNAVNLTIPGTGREEQKNKNIRNHNDKLRAHLKTPHLPEIICKSLYTARYNEAPPEELEFSAKAGLGDRVGAPIIPAKIENQAQRGIVLLLDISGSVSQEPLWGVREAAEPFLNLLSQWGRREVNLGITVFPPLPWHGGNEDGGQVVFPMTRVTPEGVRRALEVLNCPGLPQRGQPPLLKGIHTALQLLGDEKEKNLIILSDGNRSNNCAAAATLEDEKATQLREQLKSKGVQLFTAGCGGFGHLITTGKPFLPGTIAEILGVDAEIDAAGLMEEKGTRGFHLPITEHDRSAAILLTWQTPQSERLNLRLQTPDRTALALTATRINVKQGATYTLVTLDKLFLKSLPPTASSLQLQIEGSGIGKGEGENYTFSVFKDSPLKMNLQFHKDRYYVGEPITVTACISDSGQRLRDLREVTVSVTAPLQGMGNWHAAHPVPAGQLGESGEAAVSEGPSDQSLLEEKVRYLTQVKGVSLPQAGDPVLYKCYDDGTHGDVTAGDGIYTAVIKETGVEGQYRFRLHMEGDRFQRSSLSSIAVSVMPDAHHSVLRLQLREAAGGDDAADYRVTFTPKDSAGNHLGPGHRVAVQYRSHFQPTPPVALTDRLDGTYTGAVPWPPRGEKQPQLTLFLDGHPFSSVATLPRASKWRIGVQAGINVPTASMFDYFQDTGFHLGVICGYRLGSQFSLCADAGYYGFTAGTAVVEGARWWTAGLNLRSQIRLNRFDIFFNVGPRFYVDGDGKNHGGANCGAGVSFSLGSGHLLEVGGDFSWVGMPGIDSSYVTTYTRFVLQL